jgi:hypothetical protein
VLQSATPTRLTAAEAEELHELIRAYGAAKFALGLAAMLHPREDKYDQAEKESDDALLALHDWQLRHGLESK